MPINHRTMMPAKMRQRSTWRRTGFTFVELIMGMTVTAMIGAALATFTLAVGKSWSESEASQSIRLRANQASLRIMPIMQNAKHPGCLRAGSFDGSAPQPATLFFWADDANNDGAMQLGELALIEHDTLDDSIELYRVQYPPEYTSAQIAAIESIAVTSDELNSDTAPETFKSAVRQIKSGYVPRTLVSEVVGARFEVSGAGSDDERPRFVYTLRLQDGRWTIREYGAATLRGALTPTN